MHGKEKHSKEMHSKEMHSKEKQSKDGLRSLLPIFDGDCYEHFVYLS